MKQTLVYTTVTVVAAWLAASRGVTADKIAPKAQQARAILEASGFSGGLVVHLGCGDGELTAALRAGDGYVVHGLDTDPDNVARARTHVRAAADYGNVSVDHFEGQRLPYLDHLLNLIVIGDTRHEIPDEALKRVLAPRGRIIASAGTRVPQPAIFLVTHHWSQDLPLLARGMVLADKTIFVAGPADTIDEEQAFRQVNDPAVAAKLAEQAAALAGGQGALLRAVNSTDGSPLAETQLDAPPVFDGVAAAYGCLYMATTDGRVVCFEGE